eukprot:1506084-Amphidinium_carterae.1
MSHEFQSGRPAQASPRASFAQSSSTSGMASPLGVHTQVPRNLKSADKEGVELVNSKPATKSSFHQDATLSTVHVERHIQKIEREATLQRKLLKFVQRHPLLAAT